MSGEEDHYTQLGGYKNGIVDIWDTDRPALGRNGTYNCYQYAERTLGIIRAHDPARPLFLYNAWQEAHTPNEVPDVFLGPKLGWPLRRTFAAMVRCMDSALGNVTRALKDKGMWNRTLVVFSRCVPGPAATTQPCLQCSATTHSPAPLPAAPPRPLALE